MSEDKTGTLTKKPRIDKIQIFMLKYHLTYDLATFWVDQLIERGEAITIENLEYIMLDLNYTEHLLYAQGVPQ